MNTIITGATKGIGYAIAEELAKKGHNLCICARSESDLKEMKEKFASTYPSIQLYTMPADMSKKEDVLNFAKFCLSNCTTIDVLVNNAGVFLPGETLEEEDGALEKMIETNLYSAYYLSKKIVPAMKAAKSGYVINMCSIASKIAYPNGGSYSISKFALLGFSKVLREELKSTGVKVTSILPGATWSNSWAGVDLPKERLMEANDIASVVSNLIGLGDSAVMEEVVLRPQLGDL